MQTTNFKIISSFLGTHIFYTMFFYSFFKLADRIDTDTVVVWTMEANVGCLQK
jgi:hypothetical protein